MLCRRYFQPIILALFSLLLNCSDEGNSENSISQRAYLQFHLAAEQQTPDTHIMKLIGTEREITLNPDTILDLSHVKRIGDSKGVLGGASAENFHFVFNLEFTQEGATILQEVTRNNRNKRMCLVVDGQLIVAPVITAEIRNGRFPVVLKDKELVNMLIQDIDKALKSYSQN